MAPAKGPQIKAHLHFSPLFFAVSLFSFAWRGGAGGQGVGGAITAASQKAEIRGEETSPLFQEQTRRVQLPVSTVGHYEFRGATHPRACQDGLTRKQEPLFPRRTSFTASLFQLRFLLILWRRIRGGWNLISWVHAGEAAVFYCWWRCGREQGGLGRGVGGRLAVQGYRCSKESRQHKHDKLCLSRLLTECWSGAIVAAVENPPGETALQHRPRVPPRRSRFVRTKRDLTRDKSSQSIFNHRRRRSANRRWRRHWRHVTWRWTAVR